MFLGAFLLRPDDHEIHNRKKNRTKEHQKLISSLSKGDEVVTSGGMLGKILKVGDNSIKVEIAEGVAVKLQKNSISSVLPKGSLKLD